MKLLLAFVMVLCFFGIQAQVSAQSGTTTTISPIWDARGNPIPGGGIMTFDEQTHDFGELEQGGDASWTFKFTNTGTEPLWVVNAKPSCGCVTAQVWPMEAVLPGQSGGIRVNYYSQRIGTLDKSVTVCSNAAESTQKIYIKGEILPRPAKPDYSAPDAAAPSLPSDH